MGAIGAAPGGVVGVEARVIAALKSWMVDAARAMLRGGAGGGAGGAEGAASDLQWKVALFLRDTGRADEASALLREALAARTAALGADDTSTLFVARELSFLLLGARSDAPRAILNAEDECVLSVSLMGTCGVMRYPQTGLRSPDIDLFFPDPYPVPLTRRIKKKMDEIERALRWQDLYAPPLGAGDLSVWGGSGVNSSLVDSASLVDTYLFVDGSHWDADIIGTTQTQSAPARVARGLPELPRVAASGLAPLELADPSRGSALSSAVPYVAASRHANGAVAVATLGRIDAGALWYFPLANVSVRIANSPSDAAAAGPFGIFGHYNALELRFDSDFRAPGVARLLASDLAGGDAVDITAAASISADGRSIIVPGAVIESVGLAGRSNGDSSDPGMLLVLTPPAAPQAPQVSIGNIALMPNVLPTFSLIDWRARATALVDHVLSASSAALGTTEVYTAASAGPALGRRVFDVATYVGAPPKRESFLPLELLLTAAALGRLSLDAACSPLLDDCVATALQYAGADGVSKYTLPTLLYCTQYSNHRNTRSHIPAQSATMSHPRRLHLRT